MRTTKKRITFKKELLCAGILLGIVFLLSRHAPAAEWYMRKIYPILATALSSFSGLFPFSLYDLFVGMAVAMLLVLVLMVLFKKRSRLRSLRWLFRFVIILVAWFYFGWGIAYFREDFYRRTGTEEAAFDKEALREFAMRYIRQVNEAYVDCEGLDRPQARLRVEEGYQDLKDFLRIAYPNGRRSPKPMMLEPVYTKMGVSGYFGPFFNEIHVNGYSLDMSYPFTLAHEMAHQFGIATESEANLYAFLVCLESGDATLRYSAFFSSLRYLLNDIYRFLPDDYEKLAASLRPQVRADLERNRNHWLAARDKSLSEAHGRVYDAYLKTNRVSGGVENYSKVTGLLISISSEIFSNPAADLQN